MSDIEEDRGDRFAGTARRVASAVARHGVLVAPLVLVNAAAIYGQVQWAVNHLTDGDYRQAVLFAATLESIAVYLAYEAHSALVAGDASFRLRVMSYAAAGVVGALNYSHFAAADLHPTTSAVTYGMLSTISPWLWSIRSRSLRRDQLRSKGLIDPRGAHFAAAKWMLFPRRTIKAYRWAVDKGIQEERGAWEAYRLVDMKSGGGHSGVSVEVAEGLAVERQRELEQGSTVESAPADSRPVDSKPGAAVSSRRLATVTGSGIGSGNGKVDKDAVFAWLLEEHAAGRQPNGTDVAERFGISKPTGRRYRNEWLSRPGESRAHEEAEK